MEPSPDKKARTFYWYFRPIAIFSMLVGVLPLQNTYHKNGSRLRFKVFSFPHIYSSIIFYSSAYCLYYYSGFVFMSDSHEIGFIWRCIALYLMTARSAICYVYCTTHAKKFTKLIKLLELFDMKKTDVLQLDENTGFKRFLAWTVGPLMFGIFFVMGGFYELSGIAEGIFNETLHYHEQVEVASKLFGLLGIWQIAPLLLYVYFTMIIKHNLVEIVRILKSNKIVCNFAVKNSNIGNADYVVNTRHMYTIITASVRKVSDIFGNFLAIDQFCLIAMFVVNIYVYFFTSNQDSHLIIYTLINAVIIGIVINLSNKLKEMVTV